MDENDPSIYAMENKTGWRIDGGKWKDVCSLAGCLIVISDIVTDRLNSYIKHHPTCKSKMQSVKIFTQWMLEWASNLTLTYKMPEIKKQLDVCLDCLSDSKARSVEWSKAPQVLKEYLREHYEPFYKFHFPASSNSEQSEDSEEEEERDVHKHSDNETESENEFESQKSAGTRNVKGKLESPHKQGGSLSMSFCEVAGDESDTRESLGFEEFLNLPSSKEVSFSNSLLGTPGRQPSTSLSGWPLDSIPEECVDPQTKAANEVEGWLECCQDSALGVEGVTPQDMHAHAVRYGLLKKSFESMQLGLLEYQVFQDWSSQHEPLERPVPLAEHPEQLAIFNSWVELSESSRPTTAQTAVSMRNNPKEVHAQPHFLICCANRMSTSLYWTGAEMGRCWQSRRVTCKNSSPKQFISALRCLHGSTLVCRSSIVLKFNPC